MDRRSFSEALGALFGAGSLPDISTVSGKKSKTKRTVCKKHKALGLGFHYHEIEEGAKPTKKDQKNVVENGLIVSNNFDSVNRKEMFCVGCIADKFIELGIPMPNYPRN